MCELLAAMFQPAMLSCLLPFNAGFLPCRYVNKGHAGHSQFFTAMYWLL